MKRFGTAVLAITLALGSGLALAQHADLAGTSGPLQPFAIQAPTGSPCVPGTPDLIVHDDGVAENGYGWQPTVTDGRLSDKFTPGAYPATIRTVCFAFLTNAGTTTLNFSVAVYAADGTGGSPGTLLGTKALVGHPVMISGVPVTPTFEAFDISDLNLNITSGSVYIAANWVPTSTGGGVFVAADESSATASAGGYSWSNAGPWQTIQTGFPAYRAMMIRATMPLAGPGAPSLGKAFAPSQIPLGGTSTLTITLNNASQPTAAVLSSALTDSLPSGVVVAATPNASTTCPSGTVTAAAGSGSVSLGSGAQIPASGSCTIKVDVTSASNGSYVNTIPAGALVTQHGSNAGAANATLQAGFVFPEPYCNVAFPSNVEPITRVVIGGIDNSSSPVLNGSPALENFTAFIGTVAAGTNATIAVEGNTDGPFTTYVSAYIDWNQNGTFDANEGYNVGSINSSTGTDGQQATGTIAVPVDAVAGDTRMRVIKKWASSVSYPAACNTTGFGQAEDYTLHVSNGSGDPPSATVTPASLSFSTTTDGTDSATLNIANATGSDLLTWAITARGEQTRGLSRKSVALSPAAESKLLELAQRGPHKLVAQGSHSAIRSAAAPWAPEGTIQFVLDDGSYENNIGWVDDSSGTQLEYPAIWVNRFTVTEALTVDSISIMWPTNTGGTLVGKQVNLVAYYDADGDGNPINAVRLGTDTLVTIGALDTFETYTTSFSVPGAGDVYIGFIDSFASGGLEPALFPAAIDQSSASAGRSYVAGSDTGDVDPNIGANDTIGTIDSFGFAGNWLIRGTGTGGSGGPCTGPIVPWLTAAPASGSVPGGNAVDVTITANPAAGSLDAGSYTAELCITTNDPAHPLITVPVSLTVTTPDLIFKDGFDGSAGNPDIVVSGPINHAVQNNIDGTSVHWITGDIQDADVPNYHFNPYNNNLQLTFWWNTGAPDIAGVSASASTSDFLVLQSGAEIGPSSTWSTVNNPGSAAWAAGVDGYLGFRFNCSSLPSPPPSGICYGYVHLKTTAPNGFPATIVDYAYNKAGASITVP